MDVVFVLVGLICLFFGGDFLVRGAVSLSAKLGLPAFLISLTVVGFGTSMPELLVSARAALVGAPGIALGNVVGSNIANILLILGVTAVILPIQMAAANSTRDLIVMLGSAMILVGLFYTGAVSSIFGFVMVLCLIFYLVFAYLQDRTKRRNELEDQVIDSPLAMTTTFLAGGLGLLVVGADFLVRGATSLAAGFGVSDAIIGLTVVAVGTSLPELATSITAALKRKPDIAIGNVVGSNIFNILGILGITAMIAPIPVAARFLSVDGWVMLCTTSILFGLILCRKDIGRLLGMAFLVSYLIYILTMA